MKAKICVTSIVICFGISVFTLKAQVIPNFNFENWTNGANSAPDGWIDNGNNHLGFYPATQTTDKYFGLYAVRIESNVNATDTSKGNISTIRPNGLDGFGPSFPIASRYNNLKGFYKYASFNGDSAQMIVFLTKTGFIGPWQNLLAFGQKNLGAAATFTPFSVGYMESSPNFFYNDNVLIPDSGFINLSAFKSIDGSAHDLRPLGNSILIVDALNFDTYFSGINESVDIAENFVLYPNINNGIFDIKFETSGIDYTTIKIYDMNAKEIMNLFSGNLNTGIHDIHYNIQDLENGNYLFVLASDKGYKATKFVIQK